MCEPGAPGHSASPPTHRWLAGPDDPRQAPRPGNVLVGAAVPVLTVVWVLVESIPTAEAAITVLVAGAVGAALSFLVRWPVPALAVALGGVIVSLLLHQVGPPLIVASEIAVFGVAVMRPRREAAMAAGVSMVVLFGVGWADTTGPLTEPRLLIVAVWTGLAFALGDGMRAQRAYVSALAERARRVQETSEQEARARVAEERVRIARELHDVVAHHIAVISVHAGLARRALGRDAATVDSSLGHVQEAAHTVLAELGTVLRVLRAGDDEEPGTEPSPGLSRVEALLGTFADAGFMVRTSMSGRPREMDRTCDLAAFRIIQESLTNASKHGSGGEADLALAYEDDALTVTVRNLVRPAAAASPPHAKSGGQGLVGMRERATACGGSLAANREDGGEFRVCAVIPYRPRVAPEVSPAEGVPSRECGPARKAGLP